MVDVCKQLLSSESVKVSTRDIGIICGFRSQVKYNAGPPLWRSPRAYSPTHSLTMPYNAPTIFPTFSPLPAGVEAAASPSRRAPRYEYDLSLLIVALRDDLLFPSGAINVGSVEDFQVSCLPVPPPSSPLTPHPSSPISMPISILSTGPRSENHHNFNCVDESGASTGNEGKRGYSMTAVTHATSQCLSLPLSLCVVRAVHEGVAGPPG